MDRHKFLRLDVAILGLGLAALVRVNRFDAKPLSVDEAFSWRLAGCSIPDLVRRTAEDVHPPLHYLVLKGWMSVAGDSLVALRVPSVVCGVLGVLFSLLATIELMAFVPDDRDGHRPQAALAGAIAAGWLAFCPLQVEMGRTARMYGLGIALAAFSTWALLRAAANRGHDRWAWPAYIMSAALFLLTHNYALFTVAAQVLVVSLLTVLRGCRLDEGAVIRGSLKRLAVATGLVGLAYLPWVLVLAWQVREVRADYWIVVPEALDLKHELISWAAAAENLGGTEAALWGLILAVLVLSSLVRRDPAALAALGMAAAPWVGCLVVSVVMGRSIYQLRYLCFAQVFFCMFLGIATARLPATLPRLVVAFALLSTALLGQLDRVHRLPSGRPAITLAVDHLKSQAAASDLILVERAAEVNRLRYYALHAGVANPVVMARIHRDATSGHISHYASLDAGDFLDTHLPPHPAGRRLWAASTHEGWVRGLPDGLEPVGHPVRFGSGRDAYHLRRYQFPGRRRPRLSAGPVSS